MLTISSISVSPLPQQPASVTAQPISSAPASRAGGGASARPNAGVAVPVAPAGEGVAVQRAFVPTSLPPVEATRPTAAADVPTNAVRPEIPVAATPTALAAARAASAQTPAAGVPAGERAQQAEGAQRVGPSRTAAAAGAGVPASDAAGNTAGNVGGGVAGGVAGSVASNGEEVAGRTGQAGAAGAPVTPAGEGQVVLPTVNLGAAQPAPAAAPDNPPEPPPNPADVALEQRINNLLPSLWEASRAAVDVLIGEEARASAARAADAAALALAPINLPAAQAAQAASAPPRRADTTGPAQNYVAQSGAAGRTGPGSVVDTSA